MNNNNQKKCIFCQIANKKIPCLKIYENNEVLAFADINPLTDGHCLIIPKKHAKDLFEINLNDLTIIHKITQKIANAINKSLNPTGIIILQLNGKGANQTIMHYHVHLIPRNAPYDTLPFLEWEPKPGNIKNIKSTVDKIIAEII